MTAPTSVAPDQARHDYIARVYKMSHAELFAELMRVHTEANKLVEQAVKDEREACALICDLMHKAHDRSHCPAEDFQPADCAKEIRARGQS